MKRKANSILMVIGAFAVAAMMVSSVASSFLADTSSTQTKSTSPTLFIQSIEAQSHSLVAPRQPTHLHGNHMISMNLGADTQITSEPDEEGSPSIATGAGNNLVAIYDAKPSAVESEIRIADKNEPKT